MLQRNSGTKWLQDCKLLSRYGGRQWHETDFLRDRQHYVKDEGSNVDEDEYKPELGRCENATVGQPQSLIKTLSSLVTQHSGADHVMWLLASAGI